MPDALAYLWARFGVLDGMRTFHMSGPNPITPEAIRAATGLYGWTLSPLEVDALRMLDMAVRHPEGADEDDDAGAAEVPAWPDRERERGANG